MDVKEQLQLIPGTPIPLGKKVYVCPALNIKMLKMFGAELKIIQGGMSMSSKEGDDEKMVDFFDTLVKVLTAALTRNYPDITTNEVEEGLDLSNVKIVSLGLLGASGFRTVSQAEAEKSVQGESTGTA